MEEAKAKKGDRVRYFSNIWFENDYHDGTVIDDKGTIEFDDGYQAFSRTDEDAVFLLSGDELQELGVQYDEQNNQFTKRQNEKVPPANIAYALAHNQMQFAYEEKSGELVWLQKDDGTVEFADGERMKGYKFITDSDLPLDARAKMMKILAQVAQYVAENGLDKEKD